MANTFFCLNIRCVSSTKQRVPVLDPDARERLTRLWRVRSHRTLRDGFFLWRAFPGTACQATIGRSLRDVACSYFATVSIGALDEPVNGSGPELFLSPGADGESNVPGSPDDLFLVSGTDQVVQRLALRARNDMVLAGHQVQ